MKRNSQGGSGTKTTPEAASHDLQVASSLQQQPDVKKALKMAAAHLTKPTDVAALTLGCVVLVAIFFCLGAAPHYIPHLFLLFFFTLMPQRIWSFATKGWAFFLVDYCYFANIICVAYLLLLSRGHSPLAPLGRVLNEAQAQSQGFGPASPGPEAAVYVLTEGPLAAALIAWQCSWVLGSADHTISVLIHLLPGLAMFCLRYSQQLAGSCPPGGCSRPSYVQGPSQAVGWLFLVPLAVYLCWQLTYWLIVQVCCRSLILRRRMDTSYNSLARRAAKADNWLNTFVRRGSVARRVVLFGLLQLAFTLVSFLLAAAMYYSFPLAVAWQVIKFVVPLYYGAMYQVRKVPELALQNGLRHLAQQQLLSPALQTLILDQGSGQQQEAVASGTNSNTSSRQQAPRAGAGQAAARREGSLGGSGAVRKADMDAAAKGSRPAIAATAAAATATATVKVRVAGGSSVKDVEGSRAQGRGAGAGVAAGTSGDGQQGKAAQKRGVRSL